MLGGKWPLVFAGAALVVLFGAVSAVDGWWIVRTETDIPGGWIFEFQSLLGGLLAVLGAVLTVWYLRLQILDARRAAEKARRVSITALNQRLVARIEAVADDLRSATIAAMSSDVGEEFILDELPTSFGTELDLVRALSNARNKVGEAGTTVRQMPDGSTELEFGTEADRIEPAAELVSLLMKIADLLARGWTTIELAEKTAAEILALGDPPAL